MQPRLTAVKSADGSAHRREPAGERESTAIMMGKKRKDGKSNQKLPAPLLLLLLTVLALLLSTAGFTLARYVTETASHTAAVAKPFYFSSDKLTEASPYYSLEALSEDETSVAIHMTVQNFVDSLRCTDSDFAYSLTVTSDSGAVLNTQTGTFTKDVPETDEIALEVERSYFDNDRIVTVTASTQSPYRKTISARFGFSERHSDLQTSVSEDGNAVTLLLGGGNGQTLSVVWPADLVPDISNPVLAGAAGKTAVTFSAESGVSYALVFFKTDGTKSYSADSFQITETPAA